ncbi:MAG: aspartate-semialdehyde dehydrogenase [Clostridia bacterium]|nr:aspartate-semialdehyde dehydrogenase [Clostridia bacterium]MBQ6692590.1 aspartate-semialdehyde dehydrogenase [Clostridia bacterium]MBQ7112711.1 aspartate-semialdehyde dehydrogenase [Clostridia bacterium]
MKQKANYNIAILGATGAVGNMMLRVLEERRFPVGELRLLAGKRSAGRKVSFAGKEYAVQEASAEAFHGMDIVLGAAESDVAVRFAPFIREAGAVFVDNSSAFRLDPAVPLVVPEVNGEDALSHNGIIANPNCSTIITLMALAPIARLSPIKTVVASTYQAVSGAGNDGLSELEEQVRSYARGEKAEAKVFPHQILFNLVPRIGAVDENGYSSEEMKLQNEGRKILHRSDLRISCTCVRVPVMRAHSISVTFTTEHPVSVEEARAAISAFPGIRVADAPNQDVYPMPLDASDGDDVVVGRIRRDLTSESGLSLWCCGDQIRKGAATNAVQIAELLIKKGA